MKRYWTLSSAALVAVAVAALLASYNCAEPPKPAEPIDPFLRKDINELVDLAISSNDPAVYERVCSIAITSPQRREELKDLAGWPGGLPDDPDRLKPRLHSKDLRVRVLVAWLRRGSRELSCEQVEELGNAVLADASLPRHEVLTAAAVLGVYRMQCPELGKLQQELTAKAAPAPPR